jgi:TetR/AcrR family transcriptional repressor of nem operon
MPWSSEHKAGTRERILNAAAAAVRARGLSSSAVAHVMDDAGLTHGAFYAHFESKDDLVAAAIAHASAQTTRTFDRTVAAAHAGDPLMAVIDRYLNPAHVAHPERGCVVAALGPEAGRGSHHVRQTMAARIRGRIDRLRRLLPASRRRRDQQAAGAFACMVGGLILARGLPPAEAERLLSDCRSFLRDALANSSNRSAAARRS